MLQSILKCVEIHYRLGFTLPEVDKLLKPYAEKSYKKYIDEYKEILNGYNLVIDSKINELADEYAMKKVRREFEQGFQGWEYKFNSVASSRGDFPFIAITIGLGQNRFEKLATEVCLEVRKNGQGKKGKEKAVLFPKIIFLYDEEYHGVNKLGEDLFDFAIDCSSKSMYPDYLSLTSNDENNLVCKMYKKYKKVISPMGCRAFLSPYYVKGGFEPADENDEPVFVGRFNMGRLMPL